MFKHSVVAAMLAVSSAATAVEITVAPGSGLQAAIAAAADGDVIILQDGLYTNADPSIEVDKSLTFKAETALANPIIQDALYVPAAAAVTKLTLQGLQVDNISVDSTATLGELELLEVTLVDGQNSIRSASQLRRFTLIGSTIPCNINTPTLYVEAGDITIAGNTICSSDLGGGSNLRTTSLGNETINFIGNSVTGQDGATPMSVYAAAETLIVGNRFVEEWAPIGGTYSGGGDYTFILTGGSGRITLRNNLFQATTDRLADPATTEVRRISPMGVFGNATSFIFENNVVDAANIAIWQPGVGETEQAGMIDSSNSWVPPSVSIRGNIFVNYNDNILPAPSTGVDLNAQNNICFNNAVNCGTSNGNLASDPLFVDTVDYKPGTGSPAIDAGPSDAILSDLDTSRNDMGIYGGSWSIDQYDSQRDPAAVGPYIYSVLDTAKTVANGNVRVKFVSYGRQQ